MRLDKRHQRVIEDEFKNVPKREEAIEEYSYLIRERNTLRKRLRKLKADANEYVRRIGMKIHTSLLSSV